jgi:transcriptional regulator with XRE-family HTH domain
MEKQFQTWRDLLGELNGVERKRLVDALGIQNKTLERWIRGETALPQLDRLRNLLAALPIRIRRRFIDSIRQDPHFSKHLAELPLEEETYDIPSVIYARILEANVKTPKDLRFSSICQLILLESVGQLDIDRVGISVSILTCTPPLESHKVRSLNQRFSLGTIPWSPVIKQSRLLFGCDSVAGEAASKRIEVTDDVHTTDKVWGELSHHARSCVAVPIQRENAIAGCLLVLSADADFYNQRTQELLSHYANLIAIIIAEDEWYRPEQIELCQMISLEQQQEQLLSFYNHVSSHIRERAGHDKKMTWQKAEQEVLSQFETAFLLETAAKNGRE